MAEFARDTVVVGACGAGVSAKLAGPESVREIALSVVLSAVFDAGVGGAVGVVAAVTPGPVSTATTPEPADGSAGRGSSAPRPLVQTASARTSGLNARQIKTGEAAVDVLFFFAEICLRAVIGSFLRDCDVMRMAFSDTSRRNLNEFRIRT